jgi:2-phosphosulfolactate phosphatase
MQSYFNQSRYPVKMEWGAEGVKSLAPVCDCLVIVDIMSFSTCVDIAVTRGGVILPFEWKDARAREYAREKNAIAASTDRRFLSGTYSLSPQSMLGLSPGTRLVLPSPNGSALTRLGHDLGCVVLVACLRNAAATARYCKKFTSIGIVACGERWSNASLRPSLEDFVGAGAVIAGLDAEKSPEATIAKLAYESVGQSEIRTLLRDTSSGHELSERGFSHDLELCLALNVSQTVCKLIGDEIRVVE